MLHLLLFIFIIILYFSQYQFIINYIDFEFFIIKYFLQANAYYTGRVDGLCGFFDNNPANDKLKRDGVIATTTPEFGNSWADSNVQCEAKICPLHIQKAALEACNVFR